MAVTISRRQRIKIIITLTSANLHRSNVVAMYTYTTREHKQSSSPDKLIDHLSVRQVSRLTDGSDLTFQWNGDQTAVTIVVNTSAFIPAYLRSSNPLWDAANLTDESKDDIKHDRASQIEEDALQEWTMYQTEIPIDQKAAKGAPWPLLSEMTVKVRAMAQDKAQDWVGTLTEDDIMHLLRLYRLCGESYAMQRAVRGNKYEVPPEQATSARTEECIRRVLLILLQNGRLDFLCSDPESVRLLGEVGSQAKVLIPPVRPEGSRRSNAKSTAG